MFELLVLLLVLQPSLDTNVDTFVDSSSWNTDRNKNDVPDLSIITLDGIYHLVIIAFDNDEDGTLDTGFVDANDDGKLDHLWMDTNGDGKPTKEELEKMLIEIPFNSRLSHVKIFKEEFYHITIWSIIYYANNEKIAFVERFVDSNQDGEADVYKLISGEDSLKLITFVDLDFDGNYNMVCHKHECSTREDLESIPEEKQEEFPVLKFKKAIIKEAKTNH